MRHLTYLALLAGCLVATLPLEFALGARVYRQARRAVSAVLPVAAVFVVWDLLAVHARWWSYDPAYIVGVDVFGNLPVEELLFFLVVPVCALLTFEAVRRLRPGWAVSPAFGRRPPADHTPPPDDRALPRSDAWPLDDGLPPADTVPPADRVPPADDAVPR